MEVACDMGGIKPFQDGRERLIQQTQKLWSERLQTHLESWPRSSGAFVGGISVSPDLTIF